MIPLATMEWTICSHCDQQDDLSEFTWEDTGESIPAYYERYRKAIPAADRARASRSRMFRYLIIGGMLGLLISIVLGLFVGLLAGLWLGVVAAVLCTLVLSPLGGVLGFMHFEKHVVKPIVRRISRSRMCGSCAEPSGRFLDQCSSLIARMQLKILAQGAGKEQV